MDGEFLRSILSGVPLPIVLVGQDERIHRLNPLAVKLFGSNMEGRHFLTVLRQPSIIDCLTDTLRRGVAHETRYSRKDHSQETLYRVVCTPVGDATRAGVMASFEDVTSIETAGQMRRDFVANVSHELRTPLTALIGFIDTLRGPARNDAAARDRFLITMEREAERMNRLVNDLLSLSQVETEERIRPTDLQDVPALVDSVCHNLRPLSDDMQVALEVIPNVTLPKVLGDGDQLRQVFVNLIENAMKYGRDGGRVTIAFEVINRDPILAGPAVAIIVKDYGPGIDSIHIHRLTERFYRADDHRSQQLGGTGLGLAIVKHILNRHRGRLKIESKVGEGSCFAVLLPQPPQAG
ncbi:ATP-binding protein [Meridianimarinicoccus aquatilis]|uniref:histidine kinase n=1 Tax=Meridianimarinicoccus aquatilis TaxID=2552766 RepID=A0A4R6AZT1_9RHOB|nr:ATP-binding protein [Fluviibacterium aquatile]QIE42582.1 two-component sensor histidine kinase [Rhodobacteraceae bacterium SC52]TDL87966.1 two-component sensor histidine kinase [Fluviibacterium aquatile]